MSLEQELGLKKPIDILAHETLLNIYYTASQMKKRADDFFRQFGLTDVQFNVLMLLYYQSSENGGLTQAQLSKMMLVNRANVTSLIDRMEKAQLAARTADSDDRRFNIIKMTEKGKKLFAKVEPLYAKEVQDIMEGINNPDQKKLITALEKIREKLLQAQIS